MRCFWQVTPPAPDTPAADTPEPTGTPEPEPTGTLTKLADALPQLRRSPQMFDPDAGGSVCYLRRYSADHLNKHPDQRVMAMCLTLYPEESQQTILNLYVKTRPGPVRALGSAYCDQDGEGLDCLLEGDAGRFSLTAAKNGALRQTVAPRGITLEGERDVITLSGISGDDRVFLLPSLYAAECARLSAATGID